MTTAVDPYWSNVVLYVRSDELAGSSTLIDQSIYNQQLTSYQAATFGPSSSGATGSFPISGPFFGSGNFVGYALGNPWPPAALTTNTTTTLSGQTYGNGNYVATSSSFYAAATNYAYYAFDKISGAAANIWVTATGSYSTTTGQYTANTFSTVVNGITYFGEWLDLLLPNQILLTSYSIQARNDTNYLQTPYTWILAGTNNAGTWTSIDSRSNIVYTQNQIITFNVSISQYYNEYRLIILYVQPNNVNPFSAVNEMILYGYAVPATTNAVSYYITTPTASINTLGTQNFTIEFWFYQINNGSSSLTSSTTGASGRMATNTTKTSPGWSSGDWIIYSPSIGLFGFQVNNPSLNITYVTSYASNAGWHHYAISRSGGNVYLYQDGILKLTTAYTNTNSIDGGVAKTFTFGGNRFDSGGAWANGYFDEIRVTIGIDRYAGANYTVQTAPFPTTNYIPPIQTIPSSAISLSNLCVNFGTSISQPFLMSTLINSGLSNVYIPPYVSFAQNSNIKISNLIGQVEYCPSSIGGLRLWLDAADTTKITVSNSNVISWIDKSSGIPFTQLNTLYQPIFTSNSLYYKPGITFYSSQWLYNPSYSNITFAGSNTIFFTVSYTSGGLLLYKGNSNLQWNQGYKKIWMGSSYGIENINGLFPMYSQLQSNIASISSNSYSGYSLGSAYYGYTPYITSYSNIICMKTISSNIVTQYVNNFPIITSNTSNMNLQSDTGNYLAIGYGGTTAPSFKGNIHEIVQFNSVLNDIDTLNISTYLSNKWNIPIYIPNYPTLDNVSVPPIILASTRRLLFSYNGPVIRLCNSSTTAGTQSDFYANNMQQLYTGPNSTGLSLAAWLGASTAYVVTLYNQSGGYNIVNVSSTLTTTLSNLNNNYVINFVNANNNALMYNSAIAFTDATFAFNFIPNSVSSTIAPTGVNYTGNWFSCDSILYGERGGVVNDMAINIVNKTSPQISFSTGVSGTDTFYDLTTLNDFTSPCSTIITRQSTTGIVNSYKAGVYYGSSGPTTATGQIISNNPLYIGAQNLNIYLDTILVYSAIANSNDISLISKMMSSYTLQVNPVINLPLLTSLTNIGTGNQIATLTGTMAFTTISGKQCITCSGANVSNYISFSYGSAIPAYFTVCFWFYRNDTNYYTCYGINDSSKTFSNDSHALDLSNTYTITYTRLPNQWTSYSTTAGTANATTWVHYACSVNITVGNFKVYINGVFQGTGTGSGTTWSSTINYIYLGISADAGRGFNGYLRQFQFYNNILSPNDILNIYNATA